MTVAYHPLNPLRETRAWVDLDALAHNLSQIRARVSGAHIMPAVKADAYGHGLAAVAAAAVEAGVEALGVANVEELLVLRDLGVEIPVLILEELFAGEIEAAIDAGAVLTVGSRDYAAEVAAVAERLNARATVHINVDTGIGRMGVVADDPVEEILAIAELAALEVQGVYTHFPNADDGDPSFSLWQIDELTRLRTTLGERGLKVPLWHIANSGGIAEIPDHLVTSSSDIQTFVRPGLVAYGILPGPEVTPWPQLRPILRLTSRIVKINRYSSPGSVGYGRTWQARPGSRVGVVPIGYADGYPRSLSNRSHVLVRGHRAPVVGRVSMDMITVDLTQVPVECRVGDEVVLIGGPTEPVQVPPITVGELAELHGTIPYEITCGLSLRVPRVYLRDGRVVATQTMRYGYREHDGR